MRTTKRKSYSRRKSLANPKTDIIYLAVTIAIVLFVPYLHIAGGL